MSLDAAVRRYGWSTMCAGTLWRDERARDAFLAFTASQPTPGFERVDDTFRHAASFGLTVHVADCSRSLHSLPTQTVGECSDECAIVPCDEADASVVVLRVDVYVRKVDDDADE